MAVQVLMPTQEQKVQPREKESDLDKIAKALGIASTAYGIYADTQKIDIMKKQQMSAEAKTAKQLQDEANAAAGIYDKGALDAAGLAGARYSDQPPQDMTGVISAKMQTPQGLKDVFITPKPEIDRSDASVRTSALSAATDIKDKEKRDIELLDKEDKRLYDAVTKFQEKPTVKDIASKYESATTALTLLKGGEKHPNLDKLAYRAVFSTMEKGIFRAEDAKDYGLPVGYWEKLQAQFNQGVDNVELQPHERSALVGFMTYMKDKQRMKMHQYAKSEATSTAAFLKTKDTNDVLEMLRANDILDAMDQAAVDLAQSSVSDPAVRPNTNIPNQVRPGVSSPQMLQQQNQFPRTVFNPKTGQSATVSNQNELIEAGREGFQ